MPDQFVSARHPSPGRFLIVASVVLLCRAVGAAPVDAPVDPYLWLRDRFALEVDHQLVVPAADQQRYLDRLRAALDDAGVVEPAAQAFVLVDRNVQVQALFLITRTPAGEWRWIGATAVSSGKVGRFEHFVSPLGVFAHSLDNPDFRSLGTLNENHIRGYGIKGRRIFDFGWQVAERGWGAGGTSKMRLQMHATDPHILEGRLGSVDSEGCIRIPATLNVFLDHYGILDADYDEAVRSQGKPLWVLKPDRAAIAWPGRYLVIVDSLASERPAWSPLPGQMARPSATLPAGSASVPADL